MTCQEQFLYGCLRNVEQGFGGFGFYGWIGCLKGRSGNETSFLTLGRRRRRWEILSFFNGARNVEYGDGMVGVLINDAIVVVHGGKSQYYDITLCKGIFGID